VRARALSTSIVCILAVGASALATGSASAATTRQSSPPAATTPTTTTPGGTAPTTTTATPTPDATAMGGAAFGVDPNQTPAMPKATIINGKAYPPADAPEEVKEAIWAANEIVGMPYKYGGGHARVKDSGYDCSGTVSYALHGGGLLDTPLDSSSFLSWGAAGTGSWITVYTNPGHAFLVIAGLRLDTSAAGDPSDKDGPQWRPVLRSTKGFKARHLIGF
jgi:cell wall-associated NlpC family hydrolase